jgi:hypothetical protein
MVELEAHIAQQQHIEEEPPTSSLTHQTGRFFARMARRLSSSLALFGSPGQSESFPHVPPPASDENQRLSRQRDEVSLLPFTIPVVAVPTPTEMAVPSTDEPGISPADGQSFFTEGEEQTAFFPTPPPQITRTTASSVPSSALVNGTPGGSSRLGRYRQRLAGRATKVRLQTAPVPAVPRPVTPRVSTLDKEKEAQERAVLSNVPTMMIACEQEVVDQQATIVTVPAEPSSQLEMMAADLSMIAGTGVIEIGQRDLTIDHQQITETSLVLVTLTSNPGPVVVQYVSLQPQSGFTIHLTAPAEARTTFNYLILAK